MHVSKKSGYKKAFKWEKNVQSIEEWFDVTKISDEETSKMIYKRTVSLLFLYEGSLVNAWSK